MSRLSVRELFAVYIVVAGTIALFLPSGKDIVLLCLGVAGGYLAPKPVDPIK